MFERKHGVEHSRKNPASLPGSGYSPHAPTSAYDSIRN